ncbi:pilus assembly protein TadG-related protein [Hansschlegelia sp. KR7-227]|uniref:pilus assembly protein TadG-related protein n=1 Tax=Hansschlegelia sp. KR7-227 TaxID=3400914 RepID=UPI003C04D4F1
MTILAAVFLPLLIGVAALVAEFGSGLLTKVEYQRVADLAAYAAAKAYSAANDSAKMTAAAQRLAGLHGVPAANVTATLVASPKGGSNTTVEVTIEGESVLALAKVIGYRANLTIAASAYAEISAQANACIIALKTSGSGITLSGGTKITAPNCGVASNVSITTPCGTSIVTKAVSYNTTPPSQPCAGAISAPSGSTLTITKKETTDPLAGESAVTTATSRLSVVAGQTGPSAPTLASVPTGTNIDFAWDQNGTKAAATAAKCTASWSQPTWTLTCPSGGTYNFGKISVGGGITVNFNTGGTAATTYTFSDVLTNAGGGSVITFGPGVYNMAKGFYANNTTTFGAGTYNIGATPSGTCSGGYSVCFTNGTLTFGAGTFKLPGGVWTGGGTTTTFGAGTFNLGAGTANCSPGAGYSICHNGGTLTFGGPSTFEMSGGIYNNGGSTLTFGSGSTNSYRIGASSAGDSINVGGGSKTTFADAAGSSGLFQLAGNLNVTSGGGSCMTLPAAAQHDIKGFFNSAGGTILGAGVYTVRGYIAFGANGGGDVYCNGSTVGVKGVGVTLVTGGESTVSGSGCTNVALCLGSGYGNVSISAPTSGATAKLAIVGPTTSSKTMGASLTGGASASLAGALYFPNGPISMSGGASLGNAAGQCLEIIASQITLTGGTAAGSLCFGGATSGGGGVALVQ